MWSFPATIPLALMLLATGVLSAADAERFEAIRPVLQSKCIRCHGPNEQQAKVRLDSLSTDLVREPRGAETWHDALNAINRGEMPPADEPQLSQEQRRALTDWISSELQRLKESRRSTGGRVVMRRLNRAQYQNTMTTLLGVDLDFTKNLPPDSLSTDGFQNNGAALQMSALQLEYYLKAAREGLKRAVVEGPAPRVFEHSATATEKDKGKGNWNNRLGRSGTFVARIREFPDEGDFVLRVTAHAEIPEGAMVPVMQVKLGFRADVSAPSKVVGVRDVVNSESQEFVFRARFEEFPIQSRTQSKYPGMLVWIDNIYDDGREAPRTTKGKDATNSKRRNRSAPTEDPAFPKIVIDAISFRAPVFEAWPPAHHTKIIPRLPDSKDDERKAAQDALEHFLPRAYRRPVNGDDLQSLLRYFDVVRPTAHSFESAMRDVMAMALITPDFLYIAEPDAAKGLKSFQLASRLSYFLWNTMPDEELFRLAESGSLKETAVLRQQVLRMLDDSRSLAFVSQFAEQWLDLAGIDRVAVNPEFYPRFDNELKPLFRRETTEFLAEMLRSGQSALNLLDADFTMLNERLARHYGLTGPRGSRFERVRLPADSERRGLLGHASVLLSNSTGSDSHPIRRAVWIRERLLDDPPAPPPPDVPDLDQNLPEIAGLPPRQQLQLHLENAACAECHREIDPWGLALERFDAVGLKRDVIRRQNPKKRKGDFIEHPVDSSTQLPDGTHISGLAELRKYLITQKKHEFARTLVVKLLTYGLGRSLEFTDDELVEQLTDEFESSGYRLKSLIADVVCSEAFCRSIVPTRSARID